MKKRIIYVAAAALIASAALLYLYFTEEGSGAGIPCPIYSFTGLYCPGCGISRALRSILHLDFYRALRYNAAFTISFPFIFAYISALILSYIANGEDKVSNKIPVVIPYVAAGIFILFGIMRNIPAFSFLAPTIII